MPKLTAEQKALNKAAAKLRDHAFKQRKDAYYTELEATQKVIEAHAVTAAAQHADRVLDDAVASKQRAVTHIQTQIDALTDKLAETVRAHDAVIEPLRAARRDAWDWRNDVRQAAEGEVRAKYSDVANCWSAAAWKSFEDFLAQV